VPTKHWLRILVERAERRQKKAVAAVTAREKAEASTNYKSALFGGIPMGRRLGWDGPLRPQDANQHVNTAILDHDDPVF
jgi:hypothetical protein